MSQAIRESFAGGFLRKHLLDAYDRFVLPHRFDPKHYLGAYPEAREAVESGRYRDAIAHYREVGRARGWNYSSESARGDARDVPVALFFFNRPDYTRRVFERIREFRPSTLLLVSDGARHASEALLCEQARRVVEQVDWPCRVLRNYAEENLGCKKRVSSGLLWIFEQVEEAIILEDDCLPDPLFFWFCSHLLHRYRNDGRVMQISGSCFLMEAVTKYSYWFSRHSDIWGWATWRRAFRHYDAGMSSWPAYRKNPLLLRWIWPDKRERDAWIRTFDRTHVGEIDTWDFQWHWTVYRRKGLSVVPRHNLVTNFGHNQSGTHTFASRVAVANLAARPFGRLIHPLIKPRSARADDEVYITRYHQPGRMIYRDIPVALSLEPSRVVVTHDLPASSHGVGALLAKLMRGDPGWINIRSRDFAAHVEAPVHSVRIGGDTPPSSRADVFAATAKTLGDLSVPAVLAIPYADQDCLNALAVHRIYEAPLTLWIMDDQNIHANGISDSLLRELIAKASVRLAICEEMKAAYEAKFGFSFEVRLPVENPEDLCGKALSVSPREGAARLVSCGNLWCETTLRRLMDMVKESGMVLDWFGHLGRSSHGVQTEELLASGIRPQGNVSHEELISRLRQYDIATTAMPLGTQADRSWQAKLSFPSKVITLSHAANLPIVYLGDADSPGARFISARQLGEVSPWETAGFQSAVAGLGRAERAREIRARAAAQSSEFSAREAASRIWGKR